MAAPVNQHLAQVHQQTYVDSDLPTPSERATSLVEGFNRSEISLEDAESQAINLLLQIGIFLRGPSPNLEEARGAAARLLVLQVEDIPEKAAYVLKAVLYPDSMVYDLDNNQANALLTLECILLETIEHYLRADNNEEFVLELLGLYEDILEHLWLLPHLSNDPEVHRIIVQEGVPPLLLRSGRIMGLLQNILHVSPQVQAKHRSIEMAHERLATPLAQRFIDKVQELTPPGNNPVFLGRLAQLYQAMHDYHRAMYYFKEALELIEQFDLSDPNKLKLSGDLNGNLGNVYLSLCDYPRALVHHFLHLSIAKAVEDPVGEGQANGNLGNVQKHLCNYPKALEHHEKQLAIAEDLEDTAGMGRAYGSLGNIYILLRRYAVALEYYKKQLAIAVDLNDPVGEGQAFGSLGIAHQSLCNYPLAIEFQEKSLEKGKALGDRPGEGRAYGSLGNLNLLVSNYFQAIEHFEKARTIVVGLEDRASESIVYGGLGVAHQRLGDYDLALECHNKSLAIAEDLGDRAGEGVAYGNIGNIHRDLSNYPQAIEYHEKALAIALDLGDRAGEGKAYDSLGNIHRDLSNYPQAIEYHEKALAIALDLGDRAGEGKAYGNLGSVFQDLSNYPQAIEYHEKALAIAEDSGDRVEEGAALGNLGSVFHSLGMYSKAIEYHEKHLEIAKTLGIQDRVGQSYDSLGSAHRHLGNRPTAIEYHEKALAIAEDLGDRAGQARVYGNLGRFHESGGNPIKALEFYEKARGIVEAIGDRAAEAISYGDLGIVYDILHDYSAAIKSYEKALEIVQKLGKSSAIGPLLNNLGLSCKKLKDFTKGEAHYREGIRIFADIRHTLNDMYHAKITIFEEQSNAYFGLEETLLLQDKHSDALIVSDSRRSRTLIDRMLAKQSLPVDAPEAAMSIEEMEGLARGLGTTFVVYAFNPLLKANRAFSVWIINPEQEIVHRSIESPSIFNAIHGSGITPFQDMDRSNDERGGGLDDLFAGLPSNHLVTEVEKEKIAFLQDWYNELIAPIVDILPAEKDARITLIPDGPLMDLPFAILRDPEGQYLFEKYTISITPSIKTLHLLMQREIPPPKKNLIVGNPTALEVSSLPFATQEAKKVAKVTKTLPEHTLVEGDAHKTTVLSMLEGSRFIHLACHGFPRAKDKNSIYDGAFYLTPDEDHPDGILYAEEIVDCALIAELALLSACHSGKGRQQKEGVIGPVRSFLAAGAQAVVATLWTLPDSELTISMVSQFYKHILGASETAQAEGRPLDKDEALREVMRMAALGPERNHPEKWGAFFMVGKLKKLPS